MGTNFQMPGTSKVPGIFILNSMTKSDESKSNLGLGIGIGMALGVALGLATDHLAAYMAFGAAFGAAFGLLIKKK